MDLIITFSKIEEARMIELYKAGAFCAIKNRDSNGARVYVLRCKVLEKFQVNVDEFLKINAIFAVSLENEVENQIAGVRAITDCHGISGNFYNMLPFKLFFEWIGMNRYLPVKVKEAFVIGVPYFATAVFNAAKAVLKKKHQDRMHIWSDKRNLSDYFESNVLLEEFGGNLKIDECLDAYYDKFVDAFNYVKEFNAKFEFNHEKYNELRGKNKEENVGSFRKLEID